MIRWPFRRLIALLLPFALAAGACAVLVAWPREAALVEGSASAHWRHALDALAGDEPERAREHLAGCLETWPLNAEVHFLLARSCRRGDDSAGWQDHIAKAALLGASKADLELEALLMRAQAGDLRRAGPPLARRIDELNPERGLIFEALLKGALATNRVNDVLVWAGLWMEQSPEAVAAWLARGKAHELRGSRRLAVADYQHALALRPDRARPLLAGALLRDGQAQAALPFYQEEVRQHPDDAGPRFGLAQCYFALGDVPATQDALDALFARHADHAQGMLLRAKLALQQGAMPDAVAWLKRAEALSPSEPDLAYTFVLAYQRLGQAAEARRYEQRTQELRKQAERLEALRKQLRANPDDIALLHETGTLCLALGHAQEAAYWYRNVLLLDPEHRATHLALAEYYRAQGDLARAAQHRRRAKGGEKPGERPASAGR